MSALNLTTLIARCRVLCRPRSVAPDAELVRRFARQRDAAAFEELLERYARLVWGVCRRILPNEADCEDAFQATFLALVRKPSAIDPRQPLGAWLHTVAVRVARKAFVRSQRQLPQAILPERPAPGDVADEVGSRELLRLVDKEIEQLPTTLRETLILCCLQGRTRDEAAEALGCSVMVIKGRLERGRDLLRRRLARRGVELPAAFLVLGLTGERIRAALWAKTMQAALYTPAPAVAALAEASIPTGTIGKCKLLLAVLLLVSSAAGAVGTLRTMTMPEPPVAEANERTAAEPKKPEAPRIRTDRHGDPLPDGAIARLGTVRWRHGDLVFGLAYSPDGKMIATTGVGRDLVLWDAATGKELRVFPSQSQPRAVAFSPDGKTLATTQGWGQLWDVATGKLLRELKNLQTSVLALAFAPDGKTLATANSDGALHLWDPASDEEKRRIDCGQGTLFSVAYAPDRNLLVSGGSDGTIRFWDAATGREHRRITTPKKEIWSLAFSPDGRTLASGSNDDSPHLWEVKTGKEIRTLDRKQSEFAPIAFSPDGKLLAAGYGDGTFCLWDTTTGEEKRHWRAGAGRSKSLAFSPDGKTLATAVFWDGCIRLWDVATGGERCAVEGHHAPIPLLRFAADKSTLISAGFDRRVLWWDLATQTPRRQFEWTTDSYSAFAVSPDGNSVAVGDHETHEVWLWDVPTGKAAKLPGKEKSWIPMVVYSPDGRLVASGGRDDAIRIWDVRAAKEVQHIKDGFINVNRRLCFSPNSTALACGIIPLPNARGKSTLRLFDVATGKERCSFAIHTAILELAFSPDGKVLASGDGYVGARNEALVRLWDATTGRELCRHRGHRTGVSAVVFSPDGKLVASGGGDNEDNSIQVWETATGRLFRHLEGHHSWTWAVTFAADGLTVASGAGDSTILLWDITGRRGDGRWHAKPLTPRELDACWTALAHEDATKAYDAVWNLVAAPEQTVPFLRKYLQPVARPDAKVVSRWLADLDSVDFAVRQKATEELSKLGDAITPILNEALQRKVSLEMRRRVQQLVDQSREWTPARLRAHRAIQVLEHIGTSSAREVLQALATGAPETRRAEEAKAALQRLTRSSSGTKNP